MSMNQKKYLYGFEKAFFCFLLRFMTNCVNISSLSPSRMFSLSAGSISRWEIPGLHHLHKTVKMRINVSQCPMCSHHYVKGVLYVEYTQWLSIHLHWPHLPHFPSKIRQGV